MIDIKEKKKDLPNMEKGGPVKGLPGAKESAHDLHGSRVLVVCPYGVLNSFFEHTIPQIFKDAKMHFVDHATVQGKPYNAPVREEQPYQKPLMLIDFMETYFTCASPTILAKERALLLKQVFFEHVKQEEFLPSENALSKSLDEIIEKIKSKKDKWEEYLLEDWNALEKQLYQSHPTQVVVPMDAYRKWAKDKKMIYVNPSEPFKKLIRAKITQNELGGDDLTQVYSKDWYPVLEEDLRALKKGLKDRTADLGNRYLEKKDPFWFGSLLADMDGLNDIKEE